jgi:hypothetical protein
VSARFVHLSDGWTLLVDIAAWAVVHASTGYAAHKMSAHRG